MALMPTVSVYLQAAQDSLQQLWLSQGQVKQDSSTRAMQGQCELQEHLGLGILQTVICSILGYIRLLYVALMKKCSTGMTHNGAQGSQQYSYRSCFSIT